MDAEDRALRDGMKNAIKAHRGCDDAEAEVILVRIADRLGGYTHDEVKQMHPLPSDTGLNGLSA